MDRQVRNAVDLGEGDPVVKALRVRLAADPANVDIRRKLAARYEDAGYPDLAAEHLRLALERNPANGDLAVELARVLGTMEALGEAATVLRQALERAPSARVASALGVAEDDAGRPAEAESAHRRAVELEPRRSLYHNNLGYSLLRQGKRAEAAAEFRAALELDRANHTARGNLATAIAWERPDEALAHWKSFLSPAAAHSNLAAAYLEGGKYPEAREQIAQALKYQNDHPAALRNLAALAAAGGQPVQLPVVTKTDHAPRAVLARMGRMFRGKKSKERTDEHVAQEILAR